MTLISMTLADLTSRWRPGNHDTADTPDGANHAWTWKDEAHDLFTRTAEYQGGVVDRVHRDGVGFLDDAGGPILLGNDGRVWDGHHRIVAAIALGIETVQVDVVAPETVVVELECVGDSRVVHERGEWDDCRECFPADDARSPLTSGHRPDPSTQATERNAS